MIKKVLADNPNTLYDNSCDSNLYFVFDGGVLTLTKQVYLWFDKKMPYVETIDVSDAFPDIIGASIEKISFDDNEGTDGFQPIVLLHMNSGKGITFSLNFEKNKFRYRVEKTNYKY